MAQDQLRSAELRELRRGERTPSSPRDAEKLQKLGMTEAEAVMHPELNMHDRKPIVLNLRESKSTAQPRVKGKKSKKDLFGFEKLTIPIGTPSIHLLEFLDEHQLFEVNKKIITLYQKEITAQNIANFKKAQDDKYASR